MKKTLSRLIALCVMLCLCAPALAEGPTDPLLNEIGSTPIVKEPVTLSMGVAQSTAVLDYEENYTTKWMEEMTGVKIEYELFPATDAETKLDLLVNSGSELPDILTFGIDDTRRYNYGQAGVLIPLNEYYETMGQPFFDYCEEIGVDGNEVLRQVVSADGNYYGAPFYDYNYNNLYSLRAFINKTWLDKLGLQAPTNSEELVQVLTAFRDQDPNGNGQADEIPMLGCTKAWNADALGYLMNMFIYYNGDDNCYLPLNETGGKVDVAYDKPEYREFLKYANMLVKENLLSSLSFTQDSSQFSVTMSADPPVAGILVTGGANELYFGNSPDEYIPFEAMKGPEGKQYYTTFAPDAYACSAITSYCEHPEIAFAYIHYTYNDEKAYEGQIIKRYGEEGVNWRYAEEGEISMLDDQGLKPFLYVIETCWGVPTDKNLQGVWLSNVIDPNKLLEVYDGNPDNTEYQYARNYVMNKDHGIPFDQLVTCLIYTQEETDRWMDQRTALREYVKEARTLFAMGQMDPNNDSDWEQYLQELNNLQYKEILSTDQTAFERTRGTAAANE